MTSMQHKPLQMPANRDKLIARAVSTAEGSVAVGGLASQLGFLTPPATMQPTASTSEAAGLESIARLVELSRRDKRLTPEQFAARCGIELEDVVLIEGGRTAPDARVIHKVSLFLGLSYEKLLVLSGLRRVRDVSLEQGALRFAASSGPMDKLTPSQADALHEFVKILHD